jgi:hypothetical protein
MLLRWSVAAVAAAALPLTPAPAAGLAQGLTCGLAAGTVYGGPMVLTGEIATSVTYTCVVRTAAGQQVASFAGAGPVAVLPPTVVTVGTAQGVEVCTHLEWVFGFPGGGGIDYGCRAATPGPLGYVLVPEVVT